MVGQCKEEKKYFLVVKYDFTREKKIYILQATVSF